MKKLILIIFLCLTLCVCIVACDVVDENSDGSQMEDITTAAQMNEGSTSEKPTTFEEPTSEDPTSNDPEIKDNIPEFNNTDLIKILIEYLQNIFNSCDMPPTSYAIKINDIKNGDQPLLVQFDPEEYYFVCGYYNATHNQSEYENLSFCCVEEYTWVKFENAHEIQEFYNDQKFIVAFQINKALFVKDILSNDASVTAMEHFQIYEAEFVAGSNCIDAMIFDESFVYLNSSNKPCVYYSVSVFNHEWITLPCIERDGEYYITIRTHTVNVNGETTYMDLEVELEEYHDALIEIMQTDKYSETKSGYVIYYGLFDVEELVNVVFKQ